MKTKTPTSFRLSNKALKLVTDLGKQMGVSKTAIVEMAIRDIASRKLDIPKKKSNKN